MTWAQFAAEYSLLWGYPVSETKEQLKDVFLEVGSLAMKHGRFEIPGFGIFSSRRRGPKRVVAPDGSVHVVPARRVLGFKPSVRMGAK